MPYKNIPIGVDDFAKLADKANNYLFADKSLFIRDILQDGSEAILITRPRRWGKTLNLSMLKYFFAIPAEGQSTAHLFADLKIAEHPECMQEQGQHPVIFLSFKDIKESSFEKAVRRVGYLVTDLFQEHDYLVESEQLRENQKSLFLTYLTPTEDEVRLETALLFLSELLYKHHGKKAYILIDEYDVPLHKAYDSYLDDMTSFMKNMLSAALKSNKYLKKGVMTGVLRISKDSMLSGLNNLKVHTLIHDKKYYAHFGFTHEEVNELFAHSAQDMNLEGIKDWYNGYQVNGLVLFNPWSIMNCIDEQGELATYWLNTADDKLIRTALLNADAETKLQFQRLIVGGEITETVSDIVQFDAVTKSAQALWSMLLNTGYLTARSQVRTGSHYGCRLAIPNEEVACLFREVFVTWLRDKLGKARYESIRQSSRIGAPVLSPARSGAVDTPSLFQAKRAREALALQVSSAELIDDGYDADLTLADVGSSKRQRSLLGISRADSGDENTHLLAAKEASLAEARHQAKIGSRSIADWALHDVDDNGNCFYDAVAHQMRLINHVFLVDVREGTEVRDSLRLLAQGEAFSDRAWADNAVIHALLRKLPIVLLVVDTRWPARGYVAYYLGEDGDIVTHVDQEDATLCLPDDSPMIRLAYTGNHFLSVLQHPSLDQGVVRDAFDMRSGIQANTHGVSLSASSSFFTESASSSSSCAPPSPKVQSRQ
jgi:hypothetical protein